ncbi:MAG TPA: hypothetical protein VGR62_04975 [Candidatus Binatia bacterium]|jgi:hypothetical protein|nr:hypothetical protein [Candidatus Binatia bacterium]
MRYPRRLILSIVPGLVLASTSFALDVTGTWEGKEKCLVYTEQQRTTTETTTLSITQSGTDLNVSIVGGQVVAAMNGAAIANTKDPDAGQVGIYRCGTSTTLSMTGIFTAKTKASGAGTLKGSINVVGHGPGDGTAACTYSLKRISTSNPVVGPCS